MYHDLRGADLHALAAADALLLVDHVHAGLGVLGDGLVLTDLHALATLNADIGLRAGALGYDSDAGQILIKILVKCLRAGTYAGQTGHAFCVLFHNELLHNKEIPFSIILTCVLYRIVLENSMLKTIFFLKIYQYMASGEI